LHRALILDRAQECFDVFVGPIIGIGTESPHQDIGVCLVQAQDIARNKYQIRFAEFAFLHTDNPLLDCAVADVLHF
jgi:hypothetical protein